jgi:hypothetical protein
LNARKSLAFLRLGVMHHDAGLLQSQKLLGIRQPEPARRLERLGHIRDLTGGTDAERHTKTNDHEMAPLPKLHSQRGE